MIGDDAGVEVMFEADILNDNGEDVAFTEYFFRERVVEGVGGEFLADVEVLAFDHGHHHAHHVMPAKDAMGKDHVDGGLNTISNFREQAIRHDIQTENNIAIDAGNILVVDPDNLADMGNIPMVLGALAL